jgi:predicted DNA-binding transcriptional regulator YafY
LIEEHLRALLPASLLKSMQGFFTQARSNLLPGSTASRERAWLSKVRVVSEGQPLLPPKIREGVFEQISDALYRDVWLEVDYENAAGHRSQHEVMPLGLAQQGPRLYLVCRYRGYDDERSLAIHRVRAARATTLSFSRPKNFDLRKYDADGHFAWGYGRRIRLVFRVEKEAGFHITETPLSTDQQVRELEDGYEISATVVERLSP